MKLCTWQGNGNLLTATNICSSSYSYSNTSYSPEITLNNRNMAYSSGCQTAIWSSTYIPILLSRTRAVRCVCMRGCKQSLRDSHAVCVRHQWALCFWLMWHLLDKTKRSQQRAPPQANCEGSGAGRCSPVVPQARGRGQQPPTTSNVKQPQVPLHLLVCLKIKETSSPTWPSSLPSLHPPVLFTPTQ